MTEIIFYGNIRSTIIKAAIEKVGSIAYNSIECAGKLFNNGIDEIWSRHTQNKPMIEKIQEIALIEKHRSM